ncbi:MAG: GreA/GreB family elongation factor [Verrucomicrobiota bacterium]
MHPDLEKLVSRGKIEALAAEQLEALPPGTFCFHKSWGSGQIKDWDRLNVKVVVDFEDKPDHEMGMKFAAKSLTPLEEGDFLARRFSALEDLQAQAKEDPVGLVRLAVAGQGDSVSLDQLEDLIKGRVVDDGKYKSWWESTKKKLREDRQFVVPSKRNEPLELRSDDFDPTEALLEDFREARDLKAKLRSVEAIIKDLAVFEEGSDQLAELAKEVTDVASKGAKLQFQAGVELMLARDDLQTKAKLTPPEDQATVAELIQSNEEELAPLMEGLSLTRLRQLLKCFPAAFGEEEWVERLLSLVSECNLRTIGEIASFLKDSDQSEAFLSFIREGLQQRALKSDSLAWICRERKGMASSIFDPNLSLSVMSSLESDQLNDEGMVRSANRLRDLVQSDRQLIPDMIEGANINTIRNFASRLVNSASFDDLTRKSLVARVIKLHPEIQDLLTRTEKEEEMLLVSEESLVERKEAYNRLINEEIPQNREDIKIARSYGDLRENFEYKSAKEYQRVLMKRQSDWERDLKIAKPTDFAEPDTTAASVGTVVTLAPQGDGEELTYTILGAWDGDPERGIIAYLSERAKEILGKSVGESVEFTTEGGNSIGYKIASIEAWKK